MFSGLRANSLIYILDKSGECPTLKTAQVVSVSNPKPQFAGANGQAPIMPMPQFGGQQEMTVDVKAKINDDCFDLNALPAQGVVANSGGVIVSDSREAMCAEVEAMQRTSKNIIDSIDYHKAVIDACETMLITLNPQFAKDKEQEKKIGQLEDKVVGMEGTLSEIKDMLVKTLSKKNS